MKQFNYTITDPLGIHARPAGMLAKVAKSYSYTTITIAKGEIIVNATQLMKLMGLTVKQGNVVTVTAEGPQEGEAIAAMEKFFRDNL